MARLRSRSSVDAWIAAALGGGFLVSVPVAIHAVRYEGALGIVVAAVLSLTWLAVGALVVPVHYTIESSDLVIRSGVVRKRIPLNTIERVYATRDSMASFALSLDRIAIHYGQGFRVLISPVRKAAFMHELTTAAGLVRRGHEWVRATG